MNLLDLMIKVGVQDEASSRIAKLSSSVKSGLGGAARAGAKAIVGATAAAAAGATAVTGAVVGAAGQVAEYGDNIDKMSQKMGMSAEAYQEWDAVMQHSGTSMGAMKASMKKLANAAESGKDAFQKLGISQEQVASMSQEELFEATIAGLQNVSDTTERTYLAGQLLGRGATELGALLNTSAEDTQAMRDRVHELGGVMSDEAVKASAHFQDSLQDLKTAVSGIGRAFIGEMLPGINQVMDGLQELMIGNTDQGMEQISNGVQTTIDKLTEVAPRFMEIGGRIMSGLGTAILENLPNVENSIISAIPGMATALISGLPTIVSTATQLFLGLVEGLTSAIPQITSALAGVFPVIVDEIANALPQIITGGIQLFIGLATAVVEALPEILAALGAAIPQILQSIVESAPQMLESGKQFFNALGQALGEIVPMLGEALWYVITHLPEIVVNGVGAMLDAGGQFLGALVDGIMGKQPDVDAAAGQVAASASNAATANADGSAAAQQLSNTFAANFDFSNAEGAAAQGVADTAAAAAENADGAPIADRLNKSTQAGIDTSALNVPAEEMVRNAQTAAKAIDVSDIGRQFSSSAASGMDTSAISDKMSAITKAASAASATVKIGVQADTSGIRAVTAAAQAIPGAFASASARASASLGQISTKAAQVAASVRASINAIPSSKTITLKFSKPHIPVPHWSMSGSFNPKTGSTPSVSTKWYAEGGILTKATIFGAGEAGPEAVLPLTKLEKMLDESNGKYRGGGDTYNVTIYAQPGDGPEELATMFTQAIETRNRMRGRTTARKAVRSL